MRQIISIIAIMVIGGCGDVSEKEDRHIDQSLPDAVTSPLFSSCGECTTVVTAAVVGTIATGLALTPIDDAIATLLTPVALAMVHNGFSVERVLWIMTQATERLLRYGIGEAGRIISDVACAQTLHVCPDPASVSSSGSGVESATGCQEFSTTLDARVLGWTNTGIELTGAHSVEISMNGTVVYAPGGVTQDANGSSQSGGGWTDCGENTCRTGCGSFPFRAVMGKFGDGYPFIVGSRYVGPSTSSGNLYLTLNDCAFNDNSGAFNVHVTVCR